MNEKQAINLQKIFQKYIACLLIFQFEDQEYTHVFFTFQEQYEMAHLAVKELFQKHIEIMNESDYANVVIQGDVSLIVSNP